MSISYKAKILIIDDDPDINNLFKIFLEHNDFQVDALKNFRKNIHDLIILDLKMPKMDGITLYQKIKEIDDKVIICLTTTDKSFIQGLQKGKVDIEKIVIDKSILLKELKN